MPPVEFRRSWEELLNMFFNSAEGFADESIFIALEELQQRGCVFGETTGFLVGFNPNLKG